MGFFSSTDYDEKSRKYDQDVLTVREMMDMLAIGKNTAYKLIHEGKVKSFRLGNSYKILRKSVTEYIYSR
jgi:excisionase family DNA binding protein